MYNDTKTSVQVKCENEFILNFLLNYSPKLGSSKLVQYYWSPSVATEFLICMQIVIMTTSKQEKYIDFKGGNKTRVLFFFNFLLSYSQFCYRFFFFEIALHATILAAVRVVERAGQQIGSAGKPMLIS